MLMVWLFGCGCGFLNAIINAFAKSWDKIWAQLDSTTLLSVPAFFMCRP